MSASLVGSEMCIRDRARPLPVPGRPQAVRRPRRPRVRPRRVPGHLRAVSYTHLTLPTICSV
eukprot:9804649-Alexandrium_andersonii.AAC.1